MSPGVSMLERRIEQALHERADALSPSTGTELVDHPARRSGSRWRGALVAAVIVAALVVAVAVTRPFAGEGRRPSSATTTVPPPPSTTTLPTPSGVVGPEVPLSLSDTKDTQFLIRLRQRTHPTAHPFAVRIPGYAPLLIEGSCMTVAVALPNGSGYQGSCSANAATRIVGTIDTGSNVTPTSVVYGAWLAVPESATYVTYTYGDQHTWQRPIHGVSYFTNPGPRPALGGEPVILRAYNDAGQQLGEARADPIRDGQGNWSWF